jgi:hypothetical protein
VKTCRLKSTGFAPKTYSRATVPLTPLDGCRGRYSAVGGGVAAAPKTKAHRDQRIRDSARGELCLMRLPGCPGGTERTIWSHYRGSAGGKGMALKSHDIAGCYACTWCDAAYDGGIFRPIGMTKADVDLAWHEAHIRSLGRLHEKGLL